MKIHLKDDENISILLSCLASKGFSFYFRGVENVVSVDDVDWEDAIETGLNEEYVARGGKEPIPLQCEDNLSEMF